MMDVLQLIVSLAILGVVIALHVDLRTPRDGRTGRSRLKHGVRRHDALRLTNL